MNYRMSRLFARPDAIVFAGVMSLALMLQVRAAPPAAGPAAKDPNKGPVAALLAGTKANFQGSATCQNAQCHGAPQANTAPGKQAGNEYTLWNGTRDPHRAAYKSLGVGGKGEQIWNEYKKMHPELGNAQATTSEACISCHALSVPKARQGKGFKLTEGVTCDSCHGPSEKYTEPHAAAGWLPQQFKQFVAQNGNDAAKGHAALLNQWGAYYNKPIAFRAERCMSCHLEIDADMVAAGHPQPKFEMNWYTVTYLDKHWKDDPGYFLAKLWATGQAVAVRDAMKQLSDRAKAPNVKDKELEDAYRQATAHWSVFAPIAATGAITVTPDALKNMNAWAANLKASFDKKDKAAVAKAADSLRAYAVQLAPAVDKWAPQRPDTVKVLSAIAAMPADVSPAGVLARDQQRLAIFALTNAIAGPLKQPTDPVAAAALKAMPTTLFPRNPQKEFIDIEQIPPAQYDAALKAIVPQLPK